MNESRDVKTIDSIVKELSSTYLEKNDRHVNLVDVIVILSKEKHPMRDKLSILMNYDLLALSNNNMIVIVF